MSSGVGLYMSMMASRELVMTPLPGGGDEIRVKPRFFKTTKN